MFTLNTPLHLVCSIPDGLRPVGIFLFLKLVRVYNNAIEKTNARYFIVFLVEFGAHQSDSHRSLLVGHKAQRFLCLMRV